MSDQETSDVDRRLSDLDDRIREAHQKCHDRTIIRLANEGRRIAREESRLIPYLSYSYDVINAGSGCLSQQKRIDIAIELIAILEDENRARQIQPDLPSGDYETKKSWMTAACYNRLAFFTANAQGFNSEGLHQCVADGLNICRRTGASSYVLMFREFAVEVFRASDDLDMALHFARGSLGIQGDGNDNRKVASADDVGSLLAIQGHLAAAVDVVLEGWEYCNEFHNPYMARLAYLPMAREIVCLAGRDDLLGRLPRLLDADESDSCSEQEILRTPCADENPHFAYLRSRSIALEAACAGQLDRSIQLLHPWDRSLREEGNLADWFQARCRLIAALRMAGRMEQARKLAAPLEEAARKARDWLTLRRLARLLDESIPATPFAQIGDFDCGPFAAHSTTLHPVGASAFLGSHDSSTNEDDTASEPLSGENTEVSSSRQFLDRLQATENAPGGLNQLAAELTAIDADGIVNSVEARELLRGARYVFSDADQARRVLEWAERVLKRFPADADVVSRFAALAAAMRRLPDADLDDFVPLQRIERLFQQALDLDPYSALSYALAGLHFREHLDFGEAERCLARSFRLDRTSPQVALNLAGVYSQTDRPRDALAVLDLALREGCRDAQVAWEAAMSANGAGQHEAVLTYLDRFESLSPDQPWVEHYRAYSLLELNRPEEAQQALRRELERNDAGTFHVQLQSASAQGMLNRVEEFRAVLPAVLEASLTNVTYLSRTGLMRLFHRLWVSATCLPQDDPLRRRLEDKLIGTSLAPDNLFEQLRCVRDGSEPTKSLRFYRIDLRQPLDENWPVSSSCLADEQDWNAYDVTWGVLAVDEEQAISQVLAWQQRCHPIPAEVVSMSVGEELYRDFPGVTSQSYRSEHRPDLNDEPDTDQDEAD